MKKLADYVFFLTFFSFCFFFIIYTLSKRTQFLKCTVATFFFLAVLQGWFFYSSRKIIVHVSERNSRMGCSAGYYHIRTSFLSSSTKGLEFHENVNEKGVPSSPKSPFFVHINTQITWFFYVQPHRWRGGEVKMGNSATREKVYKSF